MRNPGLGIGLGLERTARGKKVQKLASFFQQRRAVRMCVHRADHVTRQTRSHGCSSAIVGTNLAMRTQHMRSAQDRLHHAGRCCVVLQCGCKHVERVQANELCAP
jgi:hypothetical protein